MDYNQNFEKEEKDKIRKQVLDEINNKENSRFDSNIQSFGPPKKKSKVSFDESNEVKDNNIYYSPKEEKQGEKGSIAILFVCAIIIGISLFLFPKISKYFEEKRNNNKKPVVEQKKEEEKVYEKLKMDDDVVKNAKYPIMHIDTSNKKTYYSLDKVTSSSFSNSDLLYNALSRIDDKNMANYTGSYNGTYCGGSNKKIVDSRYFKLRLEHIFTKKVNYKNSDFNVPTNNNGTKYYERIFYGRIKGNSEYKEDKWYV